MDRSRNIFCSTRVVMYEVYDFVHFYIQVKVVEEGWVRWAYIMYAWRIRSMRATGGSSTYDGGTHPYVRRNQARGKP